MTLAAQLTAFHAPRRPIGEVIDEDSDCGRIRSVMDYETPMMPSKIYDRLITSGRLGDLTKKRVTELLWNMASRKVVSRLLNAKGNSVWRLEA
jgi:hypothetical protein